MWYASSLWRRWTEKKQRDSRGWTKRTPRILLSLQHISNVPHRGSHEATLSLDSTLSLLLHIQNLKGSTSTPASTCRLRVNVPLPYRPHAVPALVHLTLSFKLFRPLLKCFFRQQKLAWSLDPALWTEVDRMVLLWFHHMISSHDQGTLKVKCTKATKLCNPWLCIILDLADIYSWYDVYDVMPCILFLSRLLYLVFKLRYLMYHNATFTVYNVTFKSIRLCQNKSIYKTTSSHVYLCFIDDVHFWQE